MLGVIFDLERNEDRITPDRRERLVAEIQAILKDRRLTPGHASKLRGKLGFATSTTYGRTGRAFMRALSERQYHSGREIGVTDPIEAALVGWLRILKYGQPRPILKRIGVVIV